jgi:hypothetical protein
MNQACGFRIFINTIAYFKKLFYYFYMIKLRDSFTHHLTPEQIELVLMQYGIDMCIQKKSRKYPESIVAETLKQKYILTVYPTKEEAAISLKDIEKTEGIKLVDNLAGEKINRTRIMDGVFVFSFVFVG